MYPSLDFKTLTSLSTTAYSQHKPFLTFVKMPRVKPTAVKSVSEDVPTSDDSSSAVAVTEPASVECKPEGFEIGTTQPPDPADEGKSKPKKGTRKPKPCVRCDERRKREREYARASRVRAKLSKTPAATPAAEGGDAGLCAGDAAPSTVMESS